MKKFTSILVTLLICTLLSAQVVVTTYSKPNITSKGMFGKSEKINEKIIAPTQNLNNLLYTKNMEYKFAEPKFVDISPLIHASKETISDDIVYRQKIVAQNATSIAISFDKLTLSKNAQLYIYNAEGTIITGPITANEY